MNNCSPFHQSFCVYIINIFFKGQLRIYTFELYFFFYIVLWIFSNIQFFFFLPYLNQHHCLHCYSYQKQRNHSRHDFLLSNTTAYQPSNVHLRITLTSLSFPLMLFPLFFSLMLPQISSTCSFYVQSSHFISHTPPGWRTFFLLLK